jgi:glycogen(starch) synthase
MPERGGSLRILMTADAVGGVWAYALDLIAALGALPSTEVEVLLAVMGPAPSAEQRAKAVSLPNLHLVAGDFRLEWMPDAADDVARSAGWLRDLVATWRPDVIHFNGYAHAAWRWPVPVVVVAHSCVLSWWRAVHGVAAPGEWRGYGELARRGLARADRVVAPTRAMLQALSDHYGAGRGGTVIANGCALERYSAVTKEPFVLAAGRLWDEGKNLSALDEAASRLAWPVYVAGDRRHPDGRIIEPVHARPLGRLGADALARWVARAAIYALPARYEPFGLSILEAAASGAALALGDIPSLRELWDGSAVFAPPGDPVALAGAIAGLIDDPAERRRLGRAAWRRARDFSAAKMARRYAELYRAATPQRGDVPGALAAAL